MDGFHTIVVQAVEHGSFFTLFYRKITLPFAPSKGLKLQLTTQRGDWCSDLVRVLFVLPAGLFVCYGVSIEIERPAHSDDEPDREWDIHVEKRKTFDWLVAEGWVKAPESFEWVEL